MLIRCERQGTALKAKPAGELDHHNADFVREELEGMLKDEGIKELVLDLSSLTFMDSSGIGVILGRCRTMQKRGGKVSVMNMSSQIDRILKMSGLYQLINKIG
ncbi:MAG: STAS domain-containing protein [Bacillota bacterium]|nr:STAS domain-containing protein [Bacillota bacterium]